MNYPAHRPFDDIRLVMASELEAVTRSKEFAGSPVMQRLLRFLVDRTIAGSAASLKAYTIAVDGLGRPADFDPLSDSYPRVQVGRLRKVLETHYARKANDKHQCLYIRQGDYRVRLARRSIAYPQLAPRPEIEQAPAPPPVEAAPFVAAPKSSEMSLTFKRPLHLLGGIAGGAILTGVLIGMLLFGKFDADCPVLPQLTSVKS